MRILVLAKPVPDTYGQRTLSLETGLADRDADVAVLDEISERALEVALAHAGDHDGTEVVVLAMAPQSLQASLRKALAMGAHDAVQVVDDALVGADAVLTAEVLAAAAQRTGFDLIVAGNASTDGSGGVVPAMIAERLGIACATSLSSASIADGEVRGERASDGATLTVCAALPAVISITEALPDPRMPNFKGIMAAKKKEIETLRLGDLGVEALPDDVARSIMVEASERPPREAGTIITDTGDAGTQLARFLVANRLA
ncbi:electron transfer flavoprotein subunit beta/FixA family protein [Demequina sp. NBRC 110056]|uniref:electron transfer flavoprotein subunit beta/FixA family protein n=1 Tax=Demequina sp. NBRC 110056 TaxID=1570345 RepID=UPI0009FEAFB8|nr:electron transfer flavoprotein subunit beta/FixA family protein [Demequina sp. NBRC 110056]